MSHESHENWFAIQGSRDRHKDTIPSPTRMITWHEGKEVVYTGYSERTENSCLPGGNASYQYDIQTAVNDNWNMECRKLYSTGNRREKKPGGL